MSPTEQLFVMSMLAWTVAAQVALLWLRKPTRASVRASTPAGARRPAPMR